MIKLKYSFLFIFCFMQLIFSNFSNANNLKNKKIIIIGYADSYQDVNFSNFLEHQFYPEIAVNTENEITKTLISIGFRRINQVLFQNENGDKFEMYNSNVICKNELNILTQTFIRTNLCKEQTDRINEIVNIINSNKIKSYNSIIYLGHSRHGQGLGIGPFWPEYTVPIKFYNESDVGEVKNIFIASCESNILYSHLGKFGINFIGTNEKQMWMKNLLPQVKAYLMSN